MSDGPRTSGERGAAAYAADARLWGCTAVSPAATAAQMGRRRVSGAAERVNGR